jgi:hypothetical protein
MLIRVLSTSFRLTHQPRLPSQKVLMPTSWQLWYAGVVLTMILLYLAVN